MCSAWRVSYVVGGFDLIPTGLSCMQKCMNSGDSVSQVGE